MAKQIFIPENIIYKPCKVRKYILSHKLGVDMAYFIYKVPGHHFNLRAKTIAVEYFCDNLSSAKELAEYYRIKRSTIHWICYEMLVELHKTKKIVKRS